MAPDDSAYHACGICALIERVRAGNFADYVAELPRSWLILGDAQFYRGYCVLFAKRHVTELHAMPRGEAHELLDELLAVGRSLAEILKPLKLNYECLGNQEPHVHWHVFPRYAEDPLRQAPIWVRPEAERKVSLEDSARRQLIAGIRAELLRRLPAARVV
ncbi:MAG TPA: HIT family protein [Candidatus Binataceae bacterium]|nr:HIT family protein [Candidatus Binataceae bacterium]